MQGAQINGRAAYRPRKASGACRHLVLEAALTRARSCRKTHKRCFCYEETKTGSLTWSKSKYENNRQKGMKITFHAAGHRGQLWEQKQIRLPVSLLPPRRCSPLLATTNHPVLVPPRSSVSPAETQSPPGHRQPPCPCTAQVIRLNLLVHKRLFKDSTRPYF